MIQVFTFIAAPQGRFLAVWQNDVIKGGAGTWAPPNCLTKPNELAPHAAARLFKQVIGRYPEKLLFMDRRHIKREDQKSFQYFLGVTPNESLVSKEKAISLRSKWGTINQSVYTDPRIEDFFEDFPTPCFRRALGTMDENPFLITEL